MYKNYQNEVVFLSAEAEKTKQDAYHAKGKGSKRTEKEVFRT